MFVGQTVGRFDEKDSRSSFCRDISLKGKSVRKRFCPRINLRKPHGSLDWYMCSGAPVRVAADLSLPPLIIIPGLGKFRNGYNFPFDRHRERANAAIDNAARFLIAGCGFNDDHVETHLTPMIRKGTPALLLTCELSPKARQLAGSVATFTAIEFSREESVEGSRVFMNCFDTFFPGMKLWDLNNFIDEVLEP